MTIHSRRLLPLTLPLTRVPPSPRRRGEGRGEGQAALGTKQG
jgi:hypothetical protein